MNIQRVDRRNHNTPILYDHEIDQFAHAVLADYSPVLLREPGAVDFEHFLEFYLGATVIFKDIYTDDPERPVFGVVTFRDGVLKVFDRENNCISNLLVRANTVVIGSSLMEPGKERSARFTGAHEGGHFLLHSDMYKTASKLNISERNEAMPSMVTCRCGSIENFQGGPARTAKQWREHHADYFAACITMPNATFRPCVNQFLREHGIWKAHIVLGQDDDLDTFAIDLLPEHISEVYGVSKRAAYIKLKKGGFVIGGI